MIRIKRAYEKPEKSDGKRILVDRLWPRGVSNDKLKVHEWLRDIAPSHELRKWFAHNQAKWDAFKMRYWKELERNRELLKKLKRESREITITLVYGAKSRAYNNAVVLKEFLEELDE
ncbi:MAG: DUF488 domain-containing protein [Candidatus Hadarchaeales archaeon]